MSRFGPITLASQVMAFLALALLVVAFVVTAHVAGGIEPTATVTIFKDAQPLSAQDFGFTSTLPGSAVFTLDDDADPTLSSFSCGAAFGRAVGRAVAGSGRRIGPAHGAEHWR
jgi:hypothetical protein